MIALANLLTTFKTPCAPGMNANKITENVPNSLRFKGFFILYPSPLLWFPARGVILRTALGMALSQLAAENWLPLYIPTREVLSVPASFWLLRTSLTKERCTNAHTYIYTYTGIPYMYRTSSLSRKRARLRFLARAFIFFVAKSFETTLPFSTTCNGWIFKFLSD